MSLLRFWKKRNGHFKLPGFADYDDLSPLPREKLLAAAQILAAADPTNQSFYEAKGSCGEMVSRHMENLEKTLKSLKENNKYDSTLEKQKLMAEEELEELTAVNSPANLKFVKSSRLLLILVGDWRMFCDLKIDHKQKAELEKQFRELGLKLPK